MSNQIIDVTSRSADQIAVEICTIREQVATTAMVGACQIGKRLEELKTLVPFGEWGDFIKHRIGYSQRQCDNLMQLYREYGELGPKSKSIANLSPTAALKLLALPADEREAFAEEHDAANLSTRKLEREIAEYKAQAAATAEQLEANQNLLLLATEENGSLKQQLEGIHADYAAQLDEARGENEVLTRERDDAEAKLRRLDKPGKAKISSEEAERLRKEGADAASAAAMERITAAQAMQKAAEDDNADLKEKVRSLQEELRKQTEAKAKEPPNVTNPNYGAFKASFEGLVPAFQQMCKYAVAAADSPEQVTTNRNAIKGLLMKLGGVADREVVWNGT